jgi:putative endonuclease
MEDLEDKDNISIGKLGEDLACEYLANKGHRILQRNYRKPWGEIDIVARAKDNTLVFVEVKALVGGEKIGLTPEDNLTAAKLMKLRRTCAAFVAKNPDLVNEKRGWRIDLVAITLNSETKPEIRHYENI